MALQSSPPHIADHRESSSPFSLPIRADDLPEEQAFQLDNANAIEPARKKRQYSDYGSLSSDPLFSEGTSDLEAPDEEEHSRLRSRRKRIVQGPWWTLGRRNNQSSTPTVRKAMARSHKLKTADSGVYMNSSDPADEGVDYYGPYQGRLDTSSPQTRQAGPGPEDLAVERITASLEGGHEVVDLSGLGLTQLSNPTLRRLHQLIRTSHRDLAEPPSEDEFASLTPSIQLYISGNRLTHLPSELFRLSNVTVLSLRNNDIQILPSQVKRLRNLKELNVAQNNLRYLPWELLDVMQCHNAHRNIVVRPNPLLCPMRLVDPSPLPRRETPSPEEYQEHLSHCGQYNGCFFNNMKQWYGEDGVEWTLRHEMELRLKLVRLRRDLYQQEASRAGQSVASPCKEELCYLASSSVRFFQPDGSLVRTGGKAVSHEDEEYPAVFDPLAWTPDRLQSTPSLLELSLRAAQASLSIYELQEETLMSLRPCLDAAARGLDYGNEQCSVCGRAFVVARAEWVEYWFNGFAGGFTGLTEETVLPFLRRVCSWSCANPSKVGTFRL